LLNFFLSAAHDRLVFVLEKLLDSGSAFLDVLVDLVSDFSFLLEFGLSTGLDHPDVLPPQLQGLLLD
jgi:hypothetical protein